MANLEYLSGFGNEFSSEAVKGALPTEQNSPQKTPLGLYAEQLSGTAFTAPHKDNKRSWLYRILPSVAHEPFKPYKHTTFSANIAARPTTPDQLRWDDLPMPKQKTDLIDGISTVATGGDAQSWTGIGVHRYVANVDMKDRFFYNADGEMLFVPEQGGLLFRTEFGNIEAKPNEIVVIPRGVKFAVNLLDKTARGYICENYGTPFTLPDLGPIGANGLAYPRHFLYPTAAYEEKSGKFTLLAKFDGGIWQARIRHSPLDVVAWHGNYAPYKYDLTKFQVVNTVSFDHSDPSIFTVLTAPSGMAGVANVDFVIFPPRWSVAEHTFRPPYYHRNLMTEFMGLISGAYDAKEGGFVAGGCSLHNSMSAHGPDEAAHSKAVNAKLEPVYMKGALAFMFESRYILRPTAHAMKTGLQDDYFECWQSLPKLFGKKKK